MCCYAAELIEHDENQESFKSAAAATDFSLCEPGDLQRLNKYVCDHNSHIIDQDHIF